MPYLGGARPHLTTETIGNSSPSFLASEHMMVKRLGVTLDADLVPEDVNGDKYLTAGTALGGVTTTGLYGPYNDGLGDGREVGMGILMDDVNLKDGDILVGMLIHGSVIEARCIGIDAAFKVDLKGAITFQ